MKNTYSRTADLVHVSSLNNVRTAVNKQDRSIRCFSTKHTAMPELSYARSLLLKNVYDHSVSLCIVLCKVCAQ